MTAGASSASAARPLVCGHDSGRHVSGNHHGGRHHFRWPFRHHGSGHHQHGPHHNHPHAREFVKQVGSRLKLQGDEFRFAGTNNYYLPYKSEFMVDDVLETAEEQDFNVVRTWGFIDIGNQDGSNSVAGKADGVVYFQYMNGANPAYNDGADGLQHLDYVIYRAGQLGLRLVIPFTNNWTDFGGMDQYVRWAGGQYHDQFYTDPKIRRWYKAYISHLLDHKNTYTGVRYKDDPTIMMWELANEPRCGGSGAYPRSSACNSNTITNWANEMSTFVKQRDNKHLVAVGDEGFYCDPDADNWIDQCGEGVDTLALTALPNVDVMSFHLYPDAWGQSVEWGTEWIERHFADALALRKPAMLGEFGIADKSLRNAHYKTWTDTAFDVGGAGVLSWMLAGQQDDGTPYPDFDGFSVYCPGPVCNTLSNFSKMMAADRELPFAPVADYDYAETIAGMAVTLHPLVNDVSYNDRALAPGSIDLNPSVAGQQITLVTAAGTFNAAADGSITFTPGLGFIGSADASYTVSDAIGRRSAATAITVSVSPAPLPEDVLHSFESGTDGWAPLTADAGTPVRSSDFASHGNFSLKIAANHGEWFGLNYATPLDLSGKSGISWEIHTTAAGTSQELAIQVGDSFTWCQAGDFQWVNADSTATINIDFADLDCGLTDFSSVRGLFIYMGNGGSAPIYVDNVRTIDAPSGTIHGFESSLEGWHPGNASSGTAVQSSEFASEGNFSMKTMPTTGDWWNVGYPFDAPLNLTGKTHVLWEVRTTDSGTSQELSLQVGDSYTWCQAGDFQWINPNTTATIDIDLALLDCGLTDLSQVRAMNIFLGNGGPGAVYIDNIRAN